MKNIISFKRLNIIYSFGFIFSAVLQALLMRDDLVYTMHYNVAMTLNLMLLSFVLADKEARQYFKNKFQSWKVEQMLKWQQLPAFKPSFKIGPTNGVELETVNEIKIYQGPVEHEVFVIDLESFC